MYDVFSKKEIPIKISLNIPFQMYSNILYMQFYSIIVCVTDAELIDRLSYLGDHFERSEISSTV